MKPRSLNYTTQCIFILKEQLEQNIHDHFLHGKQIVKWLHAVARYYD